MNKPKLGTFHRKQHALFFIGVYAPPFVAMYLWTGYGLVVGKFPFWTLLAGVVGICLMWGAALAAYRKAQPYVQMWRVGRAVRRELAVRKELSTAKAS